VLNRSVDIKPYRQDRYGRTLAEVFVEGKNVNLEMVKAGMAEVHRGDLLWDWTLDSTGRPMRKLKKPGEACGSLVTVYEPKGMAALEVEGFSPLRVRPRAYIFSAVGLSAERIISHCLAAR
jgi:hypothetical protein